MLQVRERPPLRLSVNVETPSGAHARWGADDPDPANKPDGLSFGTSMPGGFADLSCTLARDPRRDWPDTEELSDVTVRDPGGEIAWEGRLEKLPDTGGSQAQLTPQAVGYQAHLDDDNTASEIYVDQDLTRWNDPSYPRQLAQGALNTQLFSAQVAADPTTNTPALIQQVTDDWASPNVPLSETWYDSGAGNLIAKIYYVWSQQNANDSGVFWHDFVLLSEDGNATGALEATANLNSAGPVAAYFSPATPYRFAFLQHYYTNTPAGAAGAAFTAFWQNLAVYGDHGLTLHGTDPGGVLASDVIAHAVAKWAPELAFTTGPGGTIQPSTFAIAQLAFTTPTTAGAIVKQAVQYELLDWAVWESRLVYVNPRGESVKTRNWRARIGSAQLQETGPDVSRIWNGVIVSYTGVDGVTRTVGPPGSGADIEDARLLDTDPQNPANQVTLPSGQPLRRWALLPMGTTTPDGALQVGQLFLQVQKITDTSGQASLVGYVQDDKGVFWPAWAVRAGDTITFTDARNTSARRVVSTNYSHSSKTNTIQLDQPPDLMSAWLAELSEAIAPLGLS